MIFCLASAKEAAEIAQIHKEEIKKGFLSSLPASFLEKLYICIIKNDFCVLAKEDGEMIGFIAGTVDIKKLYSFFIKKYFIYSVILLLPKILDIRKIIEDIFYIKKEEIKPELLTIAVKADFQGRGVAQKMFEIFVSEMKNGRIKEFKVVVGEDLKPAIRFYEKNGFRFLKNIIIHDSKISKVYTYKIKN